MPKHGSKYWPEAKWRPFMRWGGTANAEPLSPLLRCPSDWVKEVGFSLMGRAAGSPLGKAEEPSVLRSTTFGGVFLLLPILDEWPLAKAAHGWPDAEKISPVAILRMLILAKCCGKPGTVATAVPRCPDPRSSRYSFQLFHRNVLLLAERHFGRALRKFPEHPGRLAVAKGSCFGRKLILCLATPAAVLLDGARGIWLAVEEFSPTCPKDLPEALRTWMERGPSDKKSIATSKTAPEAPFLLCDPKIFAHADACFPEARVLRCDDERVKPVAEEDGILAEILVRLDKLPGDLAHLSLPESWGLVPEFDNMLSVAAQNLMRSFAWRLPGFAHSNLPYLYGNFLDFSASLEILNVWIRAVRVGRPPLHLYPQHDRQCTRDLSAGLARPTPVRAVSGSMSGYEE